jgi:hypothetical protein
VREDQKTELLELPNPPAHPSAGQGSCCIEPAPVVDVMFDQLEHLVAHSSHGCDPQCPECTRLEQVARLLLAPFATPEIRQSAHEPSLHAFADSSGHEQMPEARL